MTATGADALSLASRVWYTEIDGKPQSPGWTIAAYARALQAYGDERAAAARAAAIEECATYVDSQEVLREHAGMSAVENMDFLLETTAEGIRAIVANSRGED